MKYVSMNLVELTYSEVKLLDHNVKILVFNELRREYMLCYVEEIVSDVGDFRFNLLVYYRYFLFNLKELPRV